MALPKYITLSHLRKVISAFTQRFGAVEADVSQNKTDITQLKTEVNQKSDWEEYDTTSSSYILNKPYIYAGSGYDSIIESRSNTATNSYSHAEGYNTTASGAYSHAEGNSTIASGTSSHAEGSGEASGTSSHAEGGGTVASGYHSHAEGSATIASGDGSHVEGGYGTLDYTNRRIYLTGAANTTIYTVNKIDSSWRSLKYFYITASRYGNSRIYQITDEVIDQSTQGITSITLNQTLSETSAISNQIYYIESGNVAANTNTHVEGENTVAYGNHSHVEGIESAASGPYSHAEGISVFAKTTGSHAEGYHTTTLGAYSHAEGSFTIASGDHSHAEGYSSNAIGNYSHAEGYNTTASGSDSHAEGSGTIASFTNQHVQGKYNIEDSAGTYADIVGNGTSGSARSNAYTLDWNGNGWYAGKLTVGTGPTENMDVATKQYVDAATAGISPNLSGLSDTNIDSPANGQVLKYDSTSSKWVNGDVSGVLYVTITGNQSNGFATTANFDDVYAAYQDGYDIKVVNGSAVYNLSVITSAGMSFTKNTINALQSFTWAKSSGKITFSGGAITLSTLTDTTISSPATGQILTYDGTTSKWVNTTSPYMTASQVNELITAALAQYGDGDTASYGFDDASEVSY